MAKELEDSGMVLEGGSLQERFGRSARTDRRWNGRDTSDGLVHIPYSYDSSVMWIEWEVDIIEAALVDLEERTHVVKFVKRTDENNYIRIIKGNGCYSYVGMVGQYLPETPFGRQDLSLGTGCISHGIVEHEFMHALGFWHEQSRSDRDNYVQINYENIQEGKEENFEKATADHDSNLGNPYDYGSVMHYGEYDFSANGEKTIDSFGNVIGQREEADDMDILDIQLLYQCTSGIRDLASFNNTPCSEDCNCWSGMTGCADNGGDDACQGSMSCAEDTCVVFFEKIHLHLESAS